MTLVQACAILSIELVVVLVLESKGLGCMTLLLRHLNCDKVTLTNFNCKGIHDVKLLLPSGVNKLS